MANASFKTLKSFEAARHPTNTYMNCLFDDVAVIMSYVSFL